MIEETPSSQPPAPESSAEDVSAVDCSEDAVKSPLSRYV
jgi:hypothetical protein